MEEIIGRIFGFWTVLSYSRKNSNGQKFYRCKCKCGKIKDVRLDQLKSNKTNNCSSCANSITSKTHGLSRSLTYQLWNGIKNRCLRKYADNYERYGGRGIKICNRWLDFSNFITDMGHRPIGMQIDRIDVDGHYEPLNCRWVTPKENANNKRSNKHENGEKKDAVIMLNKVEH